MEILLEIDNLVFELARWKKQALLTHGGTKVLGKAIDAGKALYKGARLSKEALDKLEKAGVKKSHTDYMSGFEKGTDNIINKAGYKVKETRFMRKNNPAITNANTKTIHLRKNTPGMPLIKRHEADEARQFEKSKDYVLKKSRGFEIINPAKLTTKFTNKNKLVGIHVNEKILQNEKKNIDSLKSLYKEERKPNEVIKQFRKKSGEYGNAVMNTSTKKIHKRVNKVPNIDLDMASQVRNPIIANSLDSKKTKQFLDNKATLEKIKEKGAIDFKHHPINSIVSLVKGVKAFSQNAKTIATDPKAHLHTVELKRKRK